MKHSKLKMVATAALIATTTYSMADTRDQAKQIHERLAGVPPTEDVLLEMVDQIENGGGSEAAARIAMENPAFYNVTLKNWATPWTNREFDLSLIHI